MRRLQLTIIPALLLLVAFPAGAGAQDGPYVDAALRSLLAPEGAAAIRAALAERAAREPLEAGSPAPPGRGLLTLAIGGPPEAARIGVLARLADPAAPFRLAGSGVEVGAVIGDIATLRVPLSLLPDLARDPGLSVLEAARMLRPVNDTAMRVVNAHLVRQRAGGSWSGFAGQGVVVGIYDTGIDYRHDDFRTPEGASRTRSLWDQIATGGSPPTGFTYGHHCTGAALDANACAQRDSNGHGTHVAGSAVADGSADGAFRYAGVAPLAELVVVKGSDDGFAEDRIIDGMSWIFGEAARLGRPAVVNLSLGGQSGPHDGTRLFEQAIDQLSGPGHIVAVAGGNDGANRNTLPDIPPEFVQADGFPADGVREFSVTVPSYTPRAGSCNDFFVIELWYRGQDRLSVTVLRPDGSSATAAFGQQASAQAANGGIAIQNAPGGAPHPANGDFEAFIQVSDCGASGPPGSGVWRVRVEPTTSASGQRYHMWITGSELGDARAFGTVGFTNRFVVASPGTARRAVTVGAFVSRLCWPSVLGQRCASVQEQLGDIAHFSAAGPTRDGRLKPEITAPGRVVLSARSADTNPQSSLLAPGGAHMALQGTSMATPMVSGAIALLLQHDATLGPETVKTLLTSTARQDQFTAQPRTGEPAGTPNNQWGFGKLDVEAALEAAGAGSGMVRLFVEVAALQTAGGASSASGSVLPLLSLDLSASGGPVRVLALGFEVTAPDPGARLLIVHDVGGDGTIGSGDPVLASLPAGEEGGGAREVLAQLEDLVVAPGTPARLIAALELGGGAPHDAPFRITYLPARTEAVHAATGLPVALVQQGEPVASAVVRTSVLDAGEVVALSANPVRGERLVLTYSAAPDRAAIHTLSGRLVTDLEARAPGALRVEWDLTTDAGERVAPGIYLLVVEVEGRRERRTLVVAGG